VVIWDSPKVYFGLLPIPDQVQAVLTGLRRHTNGEFLPVAIEYMFPHQTILDAINAGVLDLSDRILHAKDGELDLKVNATQTLEQHTPAEYLYLLKTVDQDSKLVFANWVKDRPEEDFEPFRKILGEIKLILEV